MKIMFVADLHGSVYYAKEALRIFKDLNADYIWILGDILYSGGWAEPRDYNSRETARLLNQYASQIVAVRGNCDCDADINILSFPAMGLYSYVMLERRRFFLTHGHLYDNSNIPYLKKGDVFLYGHTHKIQAENKDGVFLANPGSIALPKTSSLHSYGLFSNNRILVMTVDGHVLTELDLL